MENIPTVKTVIASLGGRRLVSLACGVGYTAVSNWIAWNRFPLRMHLRLSQLCAEKKVDLPEFLFEADRSDAGDAA